MPPVYIENMEILSGVTIAGQTNDKQWKIELLCHWAMEGGDEQYIQITKYTIFPWYEYSANLQILQRQQFFQQEPLESSSAIRNAILYFHASYSSFRA